jgi:hypothetical protein
MKNSSFSQELFHSSILIAKTKSSLASKEKTKNSELFAHLVNYMFGDKKRECLFILVQVFPNNGPMEDFMNHTWSILLQMRK